MDSVSISNGSNSRNNSPITYIRNGQTIPLPPESTDVKINTQSNNKDDDTLVEGFSDTESSDSEFDSISSSPSSSSVSAAHNPDEQKNGLQLAKDAVAKIVGNVHTPECTLSCQARRCIGGGLLLATGLATMSAGYTLILNHSELNIMLYPSKVDIPFLAVLFLIGPGLICSCVSLPTCMPRDDD